MWGACAQRNAATIIAPSTVIITNQKEKKKWKEKMAKQSKQPCNVDTTMDMENIWVESLHRQSNGIYRMEMRGHKIKRVAAKRKPHPMSLSCWCQFQLKNFTWLNSAAHLCTVIAVVKYVCEQLLHLFCTHQKKKKKTTKILIQTMMRTYCISSIDCRHFLSEIE